MTNAGSLRATGSDGVGVSLAAGGSVTNKSGGNIYGYDAGVMISGAQGSVTNSGAIAGGANLGAVVLEAGGQVYNNVGGYLGGFYGIDVGRPRAR